jgi:hypothetical protein
MMSTLDNSRPQTPASRRCSRPRRRLRTFEGRQRRRAGREGGRAHRHARLRVIYDCHFAVQLNHFIPVFQPYSVASFLKWQSDMTLARLRRGPAVIGFGRIGAAEIEVPKT